jgi:hypothetical protein
MMPLDSPWRCTGEFSEFLPFAVPAVPAVPAVFAVVDALLFTLTHEPPSGNGGNSSPSR